MSASSPSTFQFQSGVGILIWLQSSSAARRLAPGQILPSACLLWALNLPPGPLSVSGQRPQGAPISGRNWSPNVARDAVDLNER